MNTLKAVGYIFTTFGFLLLLAGFIFGVNAYTAASSFLVNSYDQYVNSMIQTLFLAAATPYFIGSVPMFIIGIVGFYAGRDMERIVDRLPSQKNPIRVELQSPSMNATHRTYGGASGKSKIVCGLCGVTNDLDAVFFKKMRQPVSVNQVPFWFIGLAKRLWRFSFAQTAFSIRSWLLLSGRYRLSRWWLTPESPMDLKCVRAWFF